MATIAPQETVLKAAATNNLSADSISTAAKSNRKPNPETSDAGGSNNSDSAVEQLCWQIFKKSGSKAIVADQLRQFVNVWCRTLAADQVIALSKNKKGRFIVQAVSGTESFDSASSTIQQIENVVQTQCELGEDSYWSIDSPGKSSSLETYARTNGFKAATVHPLVTSDENEAVGYVVTFFANTTVNKNQINQLSSELFPMVAERLELSIRAEGSRLATFLSKTYRYFAAQKKVFWLFLALSVVAILLFPYPYNVTCNSTLEPVSRRYVAAPFEGRLKESLVEPGDRVNADQTIAIIDDDDFRLQLKSAKAEYNREKERHSAALQEGRISDAQIASLEIKKLKHDIDLLQQKINGLEVKSPIDGIVVSGDLEKSEGAPLELGQAMFEIGPIDELKIEIEIPETERRFVRKGQPVSIRFHAFPLMRFDGEIESIFPRAEARDSRVVFVATARIRNEDGFLRPGMKGNASINTGSSFVGWNVLHRPIESFRSFIGF